MIYMMGRLIRERVPEIAFLIKEGFLKAVQQRAHRYSGCGYLSCITLHAWDNRIVMVSKRTSVTTWKIMMCDLPDNEEVRSSLLLDT